MDFTLPEDDGIKIEGSEMSDKYINHGRELVTLRNVSVTVVPIAISVFCHSGGP